MSIFPRLQVKHSYYLLVIIASALVACSAPLFEKKAIEADDLMGTWRANYEQIIISRGSTQEIETISGVETLELLQNGRYIQTFQGEPGYDDLKVESTWYLDSDDIVHLKNGLWPQLGPYEHQRFRSGKGIYVRDVRGKRYWLNGTEVLLLAERGLRFQSVYLEHVRTGDPDSPEIIRLTKQE